MYLKFIACSLVIGLTLMSCGGGAKTTETTTTQETTKPAAPAVPEGPTITLVLNSTDQMRYDKKTLAVNSGQEVTLILNHTGELAKEAMGHNFVLLAQGTDLNGFGQKAMSAQATDYIPAGNEVIVHTRLLGGGESDTIVFNAPPAGSYDFLCSFPGHYGIMQGEFIVN